MAIVDIKHTRTIEEAFSQVAEGGSGGNNRFLITATLTGEPGASTWTMDKTFNEIKEAFYSGKTCVVDMEYSYDEETREVYYGSVVCVVLSESQSETSYYVDVIYSNNGQQGFYASTPDDYPYYSWD